ncbi:uncharacterized protein LOC125486895 isoform X2 [Rhincodon typus]|uniref:uncharacterized protein LOC125486895 isoform X2 n=1 Tax=Rhincodon typus TaxID=259920 RepID=UPI00202FA67B|nr:uncharacterized protein LOC125486895 isoform X2 [Rhincodon typus]
MRILNEYLCSTKCAFNLLQLFILLSYCIQITSGTVKMESYCAPGSSMFFPGVDEYERSTAEFYQWKVSNGDKLSNLLILSSCSFPHSAIMLTCNVSGHPHEYQWLKDGGNISQHHQLVEENRSLIILNAGKDDRGTYICIAINPVSSVQAHYTLSINDLSQIRDCALPLSIPSLVTAASAFTCTIISCFKAERYLQFLKHGLQILALVLLIALFVYWIVIEAYVLMVGAVLSTSGEIAVICLSTSLIAGITYPDKGCEPAANLQSNLTVASYVSIAFLMALLIFHTILVKRDLEIDLKNPSVNSADKHEQVELTEESCKFTSTDLSEEMLQSESTVLNEELP